MAHDDKPDFSGDYELDLQASALEGGAATVRSATMRFIHRDPDVRCEAAFVFDGDTTSFAVDHVTDGKSVSDAQDPPTILSAYWDGDVMVFAYEMGATDARLQMTWRYELQPDGTIVAKERMRGGGRDQDNTWVFRRRAPRH
jgi:hypothetical protein